MRVPPMPDFTLSLAQQADLRILKLQLDEAQMPEKYAQLFVDLRKQLIIKDNIIRQLVKGYAEDEEFITDKNSMGDRNSINADPWL